MPLNQVLSAETQVDGRVRCRVNITTPDGNEWETDWLVDISDEMRRGDGLNAEVYDWLIANPGSVKPFSGEPVAREAPAPIGAPVIIVPPLVPPPPPIDTDLGSEPPAPLPVPDPDLSGIPELVIPERVPPKEAIKEPDTILPPPQDDAP